jgi:hypothetical protein
VSSLQEIELAISELSSDDKAALVRDLPVLLAGWYGEIAWQQILRDPTPSPVLSSLADSVDAEHRRNPDVFSKIEESDFQRNS